MKKEILEKNHTDKQSRNVKGLLKSRRSVLISQIMVFILVSGALGGMLIGTDIYDEVQDGIVSILCLSCIKLQPVTVEEFIFDTANGAAHSAFVLDNLSKGPVFLHYSEDACKACDEMEPIIKDIFQIDFDKRSYSYHTVQFGDIDVTHIYMNIDHSPDVMEDSFDIYDKDHIQGLPMFSIVSYGYDRGIIKPIYTTVYGKISTDMDDEDRKIYLEGLIEDGIELYLQNHSEH